MENSKIRRIILIEHDGLRSGLEVIEARLDQVATGDVLAVKSAHQLFQNLLQLFLRHLEHEERILRPVLMGIDAWGPARVASMDEEHKKQRTVVAQLAALDALSDPAVWVEQVRAFFAELRADMAGEEKLSLSADVLRDDIITVHADTE